MATNSVLYSDSSEEDGTLLSSGLPNYLTQGARPRQPMSRGPAAPRSLEGAQAATGDRDGGTTMLGASESVKRRLRRKRTRQKRREEAQAVASPEVEVRTTPSDSSEARPNPVLGQDPIHSWFADAEVAAPPVEAPVATTTSRPTGMEPVSIVTSVPVPATQPDMEPESVTVDTLTSLLQTPLLSVSEQVPYLPTPRVQLPRKSSRPGPRRHARQERLRHQIQDAQWYASWTRSLPYIPAGIAEIHHQPTGNQDSPLPPLPPHLTPGRHVLDPALQIDQATRERLRAREERADAYWEHREDGGWDTDIEDEIEDQLTTREMRNEEQRRVRVCNFIAPDFPVQETWDVSPFRHHLCNQPEAYEALLHTHNLDPNPPRVSTPISMDDPSMPWNAPYNFNYPFQSASDEDDFAALAGDYNEEPLSPLLLPELDPSSNHMPGGFMPAGMEDDSDFEF